MGQIQKNTSLVRFWRVFYETCIKIASPCPTSRNATQRLRPRFDDKVIDQTNTAINATPKSIPICIFRTEIFPSFFIRSHIIRIFRQKKNYCYQKKYQPKTLFFSLPVFPCFKNPEYESSVPFVECVAILANIRRFVVVRRMRWSG